MESFVSRIWVSNDAPKKGTYGPSKVITPSMTLDQMYAEIVDTIILNQESNDVSVVKFEFANIYLMCKYTSFTTDDMALVFSNTGAYETYVAETMGKVAEALKYSAKGVSNFILSKLNGAS